MPQDLTFKEVCRFIKSDDGTLVEATNKLLGAAILFAPIAIGPAALPALGVCVTGRPPDSVGDGKYK